MLIKILSHLYFILIDVICNEFNRYIQNINSWNFNFTLNNAETYNSLNIKR